MNACDWSSGEENSQSCSDSSSIPSTLSDCETEPIPVKDLQYAFQKNSFGNNVHLCVTDKKSITEIENADNGHGLPLSSGTSVTRTVDCAGDSQRLPSCESSEKSGYCLTVDSFSVSSCKSEVSKQYQENLTTVQLESSSSMSRTLPLKAGERLHSAVISHPPPAQSLTDGNKRQIDKFSKDQPPIAPVTGIEDGGRETKEQREGFEDGIYVSGPIQVPKQTVDCSGLRSSVSETSVSGSMSAAGGYTSADETEARQLSLHPPVSRHQRTAFPIPPLSEPGESLNLIRHVDTMSLPNVSPDSGIQSFAGSPSGNDSPGSVTSISTCEQNNDQPSSAHNQINEVKEMKQQQGLLLPDISTEEKKTMQQKEEDAEQSIQIKMTETVPTLMSEETSFLDTFTSEIPNPFRGPSVGRKKWGRPPKRNKSQMFQHKKSTLYSGVYTSDNVSTAILASPDKEDISRESVKDSSAACSDLSNNLAAVATSEDSQVCCKDVLETKADFIVNKLDSVCDLETVQTDDKVRSEKNADSDVLQGLTQVKKRGPGRPKGSRNKRLFTVIKNRAWKAKVARGVISGETSEAMEGCGQISNHEISSTSWQPHGRKTVRNCMSSEKETIVKRKRGRPRKQSIQTVSEAASVTGDNSKPIFSLKKELNVCVPKGKSGETEILRGRSTSTKIPSKSRDFCVVSPGKTFQSPNIANTSTSKEKFARPLKNNSAGNPSAVEKSKMIADTELASLIQSVQHSIQSQFPTKDMDESSEFAVDANSDMNGIEPSLMRNNSKLGVTKKTRKKIVKPKKPKLHVMMRKNKRKKRKRPFKEQPQSPVHPPADQSQNEEMQNSSFQDLSKQQPQQSSCLSGTLFGPSTGKHLSLFNRYRPSKILKQSSFRLHSSALGSALNRTGDESSCDEDRDGSECRRKRKKKKLLYFKSKHKNIVDPAFVAKLGSLESNMEMMTISEQAFIRVKPGEVPLPSIFRLTIIDVKKKKREKLILEPQVVTEKTKKSKLKKDCKELQMPELIREKSKYVRKKSQSDESCPPSLEMQTARDQCLPPKKRHRMMYAAESSDDAVLTAREPVAPEKRKVGRPRKNPLPDCADANERFPCTDDRSDAGKAGSTATSPARKKRHCSSEHTSKEKNKDVQLCAPEDSNKTPVLTCPHHAHHKLSEIVSCAECTLLSQSLPLSMPSKSQVEQNVQDYSPQARKTSRSKSIVQNQNLTVQTSRRKGSSNNFESHLGASQSTSPRSKTRIMVASLPSAEVVINPLPESTLCSASNIRTTRKSLKFQCNTSDLSDSSAEDESVIRNVCSEFEPLPVEHCRKRKCFQSDPDPSNKNTKRARESQHETLLDSVQSAHEGDSAGKRSDVSQLPRKRYQRVGLFSDFYKDDEPKKRNENLMKNLPKSSHGGQGSSFRLLPPPIHFGKHFRETLIDFQLPYDIWWLHVHDSLPKKEAPRPKFKRIRNNVYVDVKPNTRKFEPHPCICKPPSNPQERGCLEDCLNRVVFTECTPETCPCGEQCMNQRIQHQDWAPTLEKFVTADRGFGVRTLQPIESDRMILEYLGEVVSEQEFRRRMTEEYAQDSHHYCLNMDGRTVIDGYRMGNLTRFVNHSCEPNCEMQKWNVNGLYHMVLLSLREIKPFEEITYDYNFHSFNMEAQQVCRCGSEECRGVIGGKFQRTGQVGQHSIRSQRSSTTVPPPVAPPQPPPCVGKAPGAKQLSVTASVTRAQKKKQQPVNEVNTLRLVSPSMKPMSQRERLYARRHAIFLVRNVDRTRGDRRTDDAAQEKTEEQTTLDKVSDLLSMKDSLNDNRSVKTRLVALAEENPELQRRHRLAVIFNNVYNTVASCRDEDGIIMATPLMVMPSRKRYPDYYRTVSEPIDLTTIRNNIKKGHYLNIHTFDADLMRLFKNVEMYCGKKSEMGKIIARLRCVYEAARSEAVLQVEEVTGEGVAPFASAPPTDADSADTMDLKVVPVGDNNEEDIIRCICGVYRDEGIMIQCEKCFIWQHCDCVKVKASDAEREDLRYRCEICDPRPVEKEIIDPQKQDQPGPGGEACVQYLTLMRGDLQVAQGDCVYLSRDLKRPARASMRLVGSSNPDKMDIFRIDDLFKNLKGERFAAGNLYLRPHETFHEPNRKFFHNELFRYPQFETYPLEQIAGKCVVMDLNTYCKGRPKGFHSKDIYICEFRVDKTAHLFSKILKKFPINTKSFCFDKYAERLCPKRTYVPHEIPEEYLRRCDRGSSSSENQAGRKASSSSCNSDDTTKKDSKREDAHLKKVKLDKKQEAHHFRVEEDKKNAKKDRLNGLMLKLLAAGAGKPKVDLSYLLEEMLGKRSRKRIPILP